MTVNRKPTGKASSIPAGLAWGGLISLALTLVMAALIAWLVNRETIPESAIGYGVMILLTAASFFGALTAYGKIKHQRLMVCGASGLVYFGILLVITALFFGGQYSAVGETALMILCGSGLAALLGIQGGRGGKHPKIKVPRC